MHGVVLISYRLPAEARIFFVVYLVKRMYVGKEVIAEASLALVGVHSHMADRGPGITPSQV